MKTFTFTEAFLLLGAAQGFVLACLLLLKRRANVVPNRILASILALFSVSILLHTLSSATLLPFGAKHRFIVQALSMLSGPLIYLYVTGLTTYRFHFARKHLPHFLPFIFGLTLAALLLQEGSSPQDTAAALLSAANFLVVAVYVTAANVVLSRHARMVRNNYAAIEHVSLRWLRFFVFSLTLFWTLAGTIDAFFKIALMDTVWLASGVIIYLVGYFGFVQPEVFTDPVPDARQPEIGKKYEKSSLTPEMAKDYLARLASLMKNEKLYLDKNIGLSSLAGRLGIPAYHLSQVINEKTGRSFYDYINMQRIEEAKRMLLDPRLCHLSIASIGFDAGFNSLSAYNTAFKRYAGVTPSSFRKPTLPLLSDRED